ncbi:TetR family transcriptional regulator [Marmoricola endophyticus]|uniref:TetR family transcriptional regulator n=1 Tax=Marmoricola endophyticus TaxID=2040280 RepID=A0A917BFR8_9ACTN|nr:TetR family transcriptional regulator [Marmoricola endophyticus]GGF41113.1 TetR family transcriptional regulator [Marmoricola endophyticus]
MSTDSVLDGTRQQRKERTRQHILDAALALSTAGGLSALSLRKVAREVGIVPTAFYRHFDSIEDLGLALVDQAFVSLRAMLRDVRRDTAIDAMIIRSIDVVKRHVISESAHFAFIARERLAGPARVRRAIQHELELCQRELATDVARVPGTEEWSSEDLTLLSELIVTAMVTTAGELLEAPSGTASAAVVRRAHKRLLMVVVGAMHWESRPAAT